MEKIEKATFGAGCFWGIEESFRQIEGVISTQVGYSGGTFKNPTYYDVCEGNTGHAEVVEVTYDSNKVSYEKLLALFWEIHDPTTGNKVDWQYRSAIFYHSPEQKTAALASQEKQQASGQYHHPILTQISPATEFYKAEEYHQQYMKKHSSDAGGCRISK